MSEADRIQGMLDLHFGSRKYLIVYETLEGNSGLVSSEDDKNYLREVLLVSAKKLEEGRFV
jgi:hypothetical protein